MRKIILLLFLATAARTLISCCKDGYDYRWSSFKIANINAGMDRPDKTTLDSIPVDSFGFRLRFEHERVASLLRDLSINNTYATRCRAMYTNVDSIKSITIYTKNQFDITHPAGSSINDYFLVRPTDFFYYSPEYQYTDISNILSYVNDNEGGGLGKNQLDFKLKPISPQLGHHVFKVTVLFQSGRTLSDSTSIKLY